MGYWLRIFLVKIIFYCTTLSMLGQQLKFVDTLLLEEVKVSVSLPLNDNHIVDFYRLNHFSALDNIFARLEGISLIRRGAYAHELRLNGFSSDQLNITIDGMRMFGACTDRMDPITSYIEPSNLNKITVLSGCNGSMLGCNVGGAVDMTLQEPFVRNNQPFSLMGGVGYESISRSRNVLWLLGWKKRQWQLGLDGIYRKSENYKDGYNRIVPHSQYQKINLHAVLKYMADSNQSFKWDVLYDKAKNVGYPALPMDVSEAWANLIAMEYSRKGSIDWKSKIYINGVRHRMDDSHRDSLYLVNSKLQQRIDSVYMRMDMPGKSTTVGAYVQSVISCNDKDRLTLRADYYRNSSMAEMTMYMRYAGLPPDVPMYLQTWPAMARNGIGLFAQYTTFVFSKWRLWLNGRVDYNIDRLLSEYGKKQFSVFNYSLPQKQGKFLKSISLNSQYYFDKSISSMVTIGYSERMPTISERLGFYLFNAYDGYDYIGNPYLKSEKAGFLRWELSVATSAVKINFVQSFSFVFDYIMGITDTLIPPMNFYAKGTRSYRNLPRANLYSTDIQVLYFPVDAISLFISSGYTYGELASGEPLPLIPPLNSIVAVQLRKNKIMLQVECENELAQKRVNRNFGEQPTPSYTIFNFKSGYTLKMSQHTIDAGVGITNIFNKAYYTHLDWGKINRPGLSMGVFLKYTY